MSPSGVFRGTSNPTVTKVTVIYLSSSLRSSFSFSAGLASVFGLGIYKVRL